MKVSGTWVFRMGAISNWLVSIGGIINPGWLALAAGITPANYPFLVRIWCGMVFMFGAMFWEISSDMAGKRHLIKYAWIEKCITAISVTIGYFSGLAPGAVFGLIIFTDYLWIPLFMYYDLMIRRKYHSDMTGQNSPDVSAPRT
jgi:hypothetical protein